MSSLKTEVLLREFQYNGVRIPDTPFSRRKPQRQYVLRFSGDVRWHCLLIITAA